MHYVYSLKSLAIEGRYYIGRSSDITKRLQDHNGGKCLHTAKYRPWKLEAYVAFTCQKKAHAFERYLKSGSGRAFAKRHF